MGGRAVATAAASATPSSSKEFRWVPGAPFSGKQRAQDIGEYIVRTKARSGAVDPRDFLRAAKAKGHPAYDLFEWTDAVAATIQRLNRARQIIRSIEVEIIVKGEKEPRYTKAFVNVREVGSYEAPEPYYTIEQVMSDNTLHDRYLKRAFDEFSTFQRKYGHIQELSDLFAAFRRIQRSVLRKKSKKAGKKKAKKRAKKKSKGGSKRKKKGR